MVLPVVASPVVELAALANTSPAPDVVVVVVAVVVASPFDVEVASTVPPAAMVPPVMMEEIVPVHAAPVGQHATWPAASALQIALLAQQRPGAPRPLHAS